MKIAILGDIHIGVRNDDVNFHEYFKRFFDFFFSEIEKWNIDTIIQTGDLFDRRKYVNFNSLHLSKQYLFDVLKEKNLTFHTILGNHDIYFKDTLDINSSSLLLRNYPNIIIHSDFDTVTFDQLDIDFIPWLCKTNQESILSKIKSSTSKVCVGHFELNGFQMYRGSVHFGGEHDEKMLQRYDTVISGHFHHRSNNNHIYYVGTPYQLTWADYEDPRGFHIFDTETLEFEFIENPYTIFQKIVYDDTQTDIEYWNNFDYESIKSSLIKIVVVNKQNPYLLDTVIGKIQEIGVIKINTVENFNEVDSDKIDEEIIKTEDTLTILSHFIDENENDLDKNVLKNVMREIYIEALNMETVS